MSTGVAVFIAVLGSAQLALIYLMRRNWRVRDFCLDLIRQVSDAAQADIARGLHDFHWRYDTYESVSYDRFLFSLRPLEPQNFYDDLTFLEPTPQWLLDSAS